MKYPMIAYYNTPKRMVAYIIDAILIRAVSGVILNFLYAFGLEKTSGFLSVPNMIYLAIFFSYFVFMTKLTNGYTLGKMIMGLRVVSQNEEILSWETVITRELLGGFVLKKIFILHTFALFTEYRQSLADLFAETGVISEYKAKYYVNDTYEKDNQISFIEEV